jgi:hypothetical protein
MKCDQVDMEDWAVPWNPSVENCWSCLYNIYELTLQRICRSKIGMEKSAGQPIKVERKSENQSQTHLHFTLMSCKVCWGKYHRCQRYHGKQWESHALSLVLLRRDAELWPHVFLSRSLFLSLASFSVPPTIFVKEIWQRWTWFTLGDAAETSLVVGVGAINLSGVVKSCVPPEICYWRDQGTFKASGKHMKRTPLKKSTPHLHDRHALNTDRHRSCWIESTTGHSIEFPTQNVVPNQRSSSQPNLSCRFPILCDSPIRNNGEAYHGRSSAPKRKSRLEISSEWTTYGRVQIDMHKLTNHSYIWRNRWVRFLNRRIQNWPGFDNFTPNQSGIYLTIRCRKLGISRVFIVLTQYNKHSQTNEIVLLNRWSASRRCVCVAIAATKHWPLLKWGRCCHATVHFSPLWQWRDITRIRRSQTALKKSPCWHRPLKIKISEKST